MRFDCKVWPVKRPHPAFPKEQSHWAALLPIRLVYKHSPPSRRFEAWVDSGAADCLFHASMCSSLGIKRVEDGVEDTLKGIIGGPQAPIYFHKVKVMLGSEIFEAMAGFSWALSVGGILGRRGFFENFVVTFDASANTPFLELKRIHRV